MSFGMWVLVVLGCIALVSALCLWLAVHLAAVPIAAAPDYSDMGVPASQRRIRFTEPVAPRPAPVPRPAPRPSNPWPADEPPIYEFWPSEPVAQLADTWHCTVYVVRNSQRYKLGGGRAETALMTIEAARAEAEAGAVRTWGPGQYDIRLTPAVREPAGRR